MTLQQLRREAKLTQKEIAYALGVLAQEVYRWESGAHQLPYRHFIPLAKLLGVDREKIIVVAFNTYIKNNTDFSDVT